MNFEQVRSSSQGSPPSNTYVPCGAGGGVGDLLSSVHSPGPGSAPVLTCAHSSPSLNCSGAHTRGSRHTVPVLTISIKMVQLVRTLAALVGSAACASAFTGPMATSGFTGMRVADNVETVVAAPAGRRSVVTPRMGGKENAIRYDAFPLDCPCLPTESCIRRFLT